MQVHVRVDGDGMSCSGQLVIRCGPGKASYDGWDLTSSSIDLQVTFLDLRKPWLGAAIDVIDRVGEAPVALLPSNRAGTATDGWAERHCTGLPPLCTTSDSHAANQLPASLKQPFLLGLFVDASSDAFPHQLLQALWVESPTYSNQECDSQNPVFSHGNKIHIFQLVVWKYRDHAGGLGRPLEYTLFHHR